MLHIYFYLLTYYWYDVYDDNIYQNKVPKLDETSSTSQIGSKKDSNNGATNSAKGNVTCKPKPSIHFKFNQGFSNAVKRTINIHEFIG